MANIHGMGDLNQNSNNPQVNYQPMGNQPQNSLFALGIDTTQNPRKEMFHNMLKLFCCPYLSFLSFISVITIIEVVGYVVMLCLYGISSYRYYFMGPNYLSNSFVYKVWKQLDNA